MARSGDLGELHEAHVRQGTINYYELGSGQPVLFVHGLLYNADLWRHVVPGLAGDYRCITPDWPLGAHHPAMHSDADLTPPGLARLIVDFMDALGLERITLVGNDTGGALCQIVAARYPARVDRLVLTNCDAFDNFPPLLLKPLKALGYGPAGARLLGESLRLPQARRLLLRLVAERPVPDDILSAAFAALRADAGVRRDLRKVIRGIAPEHTRAAAESLRTFPRPTLIVWAEDDRLFPAEHADRLAEILPDARIVRVTDSRTFVPEDQPVVFVQSLRRFLGESA